MTFFINQPIIILIYLNTMLRFAYLTLFCWLTACATASLETGKPMPERGDKSSVAQLAKNDLDRMADVELEENTKSLRLLMTKLYKRNPKELAKSTSESSEKNDGLGV